MQTGTPSGVGTFRDPPRYLADGDEVVVEIEGIGRLENRCRTVEMAAATGDPVGSTAARAIDSSDAGTAR